MSDAVLDFEDLQATPDDGRRWEILDGAFVVNPAPGSNHQWAVGELFSELRQVASDRGLLVFTAPLAWRIGPGQIPEPDLIVATPEAVTTRGVESAPVLVVEVLSQSGRNRDLIEKRRIYSEGGAGEYWIVDVAVPSLTVLRLSAEGYVEVARVAGDEAYEATEPFDVRVVPSSLILPHLRSIDPSGDSA